ncbi:unnamed protein product [Echinostoma caproni]|uniref:Tub domain-containing protein n=1 Tax=Echinostoma caproni TaxID=27848 RepID=A0A183A798_9TREM|nr:unnamed protein product [Echinostoma caproni]
MFDDANGNANNVQEYAARTGLEAISVPHTVTVEKHESPVPPARRKRSKEPVQSSSSSSPMKTRTQLHAPKNLNLNVSATAGPASHSGASPMEHAESPKLAKELHPTPSKFTDSSPKIPCETRPRTADKTRSKKSTSRMDNSSEPVSPTGNGLPPLPDITENLEEFVLRPAPQGVTIRCRISRDKRGMDRGLFPTYYLHMEREDRKFFLLAARRRKRSTTSNYVISCDATDLSRAAESFAGKLRSNFLGTQFVLYAGGKRVRRGDMSAPNRSRASIRSTDSEAFENGSLVGSETLRELAAIVYKLVPLPGEDEECHDVTVNLTGILLDPQYKAQTLDTNVLGFKGPRRMTVLLPRMTSTEQHTEFGTGTARGTLLDCWKQKSWDGLMELHNKSPVWNEGTLEHIP